MGACVAGDAGQLGADLGDDVDSLVRVSTAPTPHSSADDPIPFTLLPSESDGWGGTPGLEVARAGTSRPLRLQLSGPVATDGGQVTVDRGESGLTITA